MNFKSLSNKAKLSIALVVYCVILVVMCYVAVTCQSPPWVVSLILSLGDKPVPRHLHKYLKFKEGFTLPRPELSADEVGALRALIDMANKKRQVRNLAQFGEVRSDTTVLVVQVHRDVERLQYLVASLAQVRDIQATVVVFSHSFFDDTINTLLKSITFCRYMQIFYPFSTQVNPNKFPGVDPADCMHSSPPPKDQYCSKRNARVAEHKHHWWWQAHFVFNHLKWSPEYTGTVIFLEEDDYVLPDLLHMCYFAKKAQSIIPGLNVIAFGWPYAHKLECDQFKIDIWQPAYHKGMAFNKTVWDKISELSSFFCTHDDASWSYSLYNLLTQFSEGHTDMVASKVPRVINTSLFSSGKQAAEDIYYIIKNAPLFPDNVKAAIMYSSIGRVKSEYKLPPRVSGGWSDIRDHQMCMNSLNEPNPFETMQDSSHLISLNTDQLKVNQSAALAGSEDN